ncbi:ABC transporter ATP-binding protein [Acinetobacter sp. VNH17]|uniref:ABC transporter ATP-binding protein n=1 Tax=Acinetobacter thutiue TaxID=2998078 RepID=A0ABT7WQW6_9GAMM|nr:ABC transporter ATP-binding protein [Acinetobacter thutiue]MCY6412959.1 ABC transporter ATP-binding protein [Acinetobacter thutiue]MDN0015067.1 ABC transporter ATP-binding protein [Acinetobacter thutiue]
MFLAIYKEIWNASNRFYNNSKQHLLVIIGLVCVVSLINSLLPYLIKLIIDGTQHGKGIHYIYILVVSYCFAWLLSQILEWTRNFFHVVVMSRLESSVLITGLENYLKIEKLQQDKIDTGVFNSEAMRASSSFSSLTLSLLFVFLPAIFQLFFISYILYININAFFALGFIGTALLMFAISYFITRKSKEYYEPLYSVKSILNSKFLEKVNNSYEIKANNAVDFEVNRFERNVKSYIGQMSHSHMKIASLMVLQIILIFVFLLTFLLMSTKLFSLGKITTGDMVMISSYIMMLTIPFLMISQQVNLISGQVVAIKKFHNYFRMKKDQNSQQHYSDSHLLFAFADVVLEVGGRVIQQFNLKLYKNKTYVLIGKTGSGKSTLINYLLGFYKIRAGKLFYKDLDISQNYSEKIFDEIAFVGQNYSIFTGSLRENLVYNSRHCYADEEIKQLLGLFDLQHLLVDKNLSLDDDINEYLKSFSGGEKQRLNILRAILKKPRVLILDEPTSALDSKTAIQILNYLKTNVETLIVITHSQECRDLADEIINVEQLFQSA